MVTQADLAHCPNTVVLSTGTVFRISNTSQGDSEEYGPVTGYFYMIAGDTADAYAFTRAKAELLIHQTEVLWFPGERRSWDTQI